MRYCLITFRSVTPAQRSERVLRKAGIACALQRTPRWMEEQGCGYSLRLRLEDVLSGVELLRAQDVPFRKVYRPKDNATMEEMVL